MKHKQHRNWLLATTFAAILASIAVSLPMKGETCYLNFHGKTSTYDYCYNVEDVHKLTFASTFLSLHYVDNRADKNINYITLRKITIGDNTDMGVYNVKSDNDLVIYGAAGVVYVNSEYAIDQVSIYNIQGQEELCLTPQSTNVAISLDGYPSGVYIVRAVGNGNIVTAKVIK